MNGTVMGGVLALLYFLIFQVCGVLLASCLFKDEHLHVRAVLGSAAGSVLLMWLPVLWAYFIISVMIRVAVPSVTFST